MGEVDINLVSVLVAALAGFVVGGLWYSPFLFANQWILAANVTQEQVDGSNKGKVFGLTFVFLLIIAYCLAAFLAAPEVTVATGALYGFLTGFGWMFFAIAVIAQFEQRSWSYILINGGYWTVTMILMGAIIGGWPA